MVISASYAYAQTRFGDHFYFAKKQILWAAVGIGVMLVISRAPSSAVYRAAPFFFGAVMLLLALVPLIGANPQSDFA